MKLGKTGSGKIMFRRLGVASAFAWLGWACGGAPEPTVPGGQNGGGFVGGGRTTSGGGKAEGGGPASGGSNGATGGRTSVGGATQEGGMGPVGDAGCGLEAAAFCETFDAPSSERGRAGDLDPRRWSAGRFLPEAPTLPEPFPVGAAPVPEGCQEGLSGLVFPDQDMLICAPTEEIGSPHLWVSTAAQTYGLNSVRVRQPFDFSDRTGKIVFDAELTTPSTLFGFVSLAVTEDPVDVPTFAIFSNVEGGAVPRNALTIQFAQICPGVEGAMLSSVITMKDYVQDVRMLSSDCISAPRGRLTHVEVEVSESSVTIYVASGPGGALKRLADVPIDLPFSRGYVHLNVHNHATIKYTTGEPGYPEPLLAWTARFDNVGFDGLIVEDFREYEIPEPLKPVTVEGVSSVTIGYTFGGEQSPGSFEFADVETEGMARARVGFNLWVNQFDVTSPVLLYRLNGGDWHERPLSDYEINMDGVGWGAIAIGLELPFQDVVSGKNLLELATRGVGTSYPPGAANLNLVLTKN